MIVLTTYRPSDFVGTNDSHPQSSKVPGSNFHLSRPLHRSPIIKEPLASRILDHRSPTATANDNAYPEHHHHHYLLPPTTKPPDFRLHVWTTNSKHAIATCIATTSPLTCDKWNEGAIMAPEMAWRSPSRGQPGRGSSPPVNTCMSAQGRSLLRDCHGNNRLLRCDDASRMLDGLIVFLAPDAAIVVGCCVASLFFSFFLKSPDIYSCPQDDDCAEEEYHDWCWTSRSCMLTRTS